MRRVAPPPDPDEPSRILTALHESLDPDVISTGTADLDEHASDGFGAHRPRPGRLRSRGLLPIAVVRPRTTDEVASIVRLANEHAFALAPYGGGTGLMGGAVPEDRPTVCLATSEMRRVREVAPDDGLAWAEAGATLGAVDEALRPHNLMLGHDPWTFNIATVGGAIGTNGLGYLGGRYGGMGDQTIAVEAVLPTGDVIVTPAVPRRSAGLDLTRLLVGTEGTLGIVTAAALRAFPIPEERVLRGYTFDTLESGFAAIMALRSVGIEPSLLDYGQTFTPGPFESLSKVMRQRDRGEGSAELYIGFEGFREGAIAAAERADAIVRGHQARPMRDDAVRSFWGERHAIADRFAQRRAARLAEDAFRFVRSVKMDFVHVALPASRVLDYWREACHICEGEGVRIIEAGVWVRPELFSLALLKASRSARATEDALVRTVDELLRLARTYGGSIEYCHGIGQRLAHLMGEEHGEAGLAALRTIKRALDPNGVLNPGKLGL